MREGTPSRTAAWVAVMRGLGRFLPRSVRLADDPYGTAFGGQRLRWLADNAPEGSGRVFVAMPGVQSWVLYLQVRTRVLDDVVRAFVRDGGQQVVLLGAGYDCRALRMPELAALSVFEVDHPDTQRHKQRVLARLGAKSHAQSLAWNFEKQSATDLPGALAALGHDPGIRTLTLWEGVTMYLSEPALDASTRAVAEYSAPGSLLALTYHLREQTPLETARQRTIGAVVERLGEPWRWSWGRGEIEPWMAARGFALERDVTTAESARELLPPDLVRMGGVVGWPGATAVLRRL